MTQQKADEIVAGLPEYMQQRIGPVKVDMRMTWLLAQGECEIYEPNCPVGIAPWASSKVVAHEAFHSFEFNTWYTDANEWDRFAEDFGDYTYIGRLPVMLLGQVPFLLDMPVRGYANVYGQSMWCEDTATMFTEVWADKRRDDVTYEKKWLAIDAFVRGGYAEGQ
jgi:hypothetical protein